jgi:Mrp family chromosome partitioning ATPase
VVTVALFREARRSSLGEKPQLAAAKPLAVRADPVLPPRPEPQPEPELEAVEDDVRPSLPEPSQREPVAIISESEISALASRLSEKRPADSGHRTLLTGHTDAIDVTKETLDLVKTLSERGVQTILIDWSPRGNGMAREIGLDADVGINDLLRGDAGFGEAIQRLSGTNVHAIASGKALESEAMAIDPDQINLVLDALDEAYDHIVVAGPHDEARKLFETIEGRFDAGVVVVEPRERAPVLDDPAGTFLGFEVADIDVIRFERKASDSVPIQQRIARATRRGPGDMARSA